MDTLTVADLLADLEESPGVAAMAQLDPLDLWELDWISQGHYNRR